MDEIVNYLLEIKLQVILQEICENNRLISSSSSLSSSSSSSLTNLTSFKSNNYKKYQFLSSSLKSNDPSHWTTFNGTKINSINSIILPEGYSIGIDWKIDINYPLSTDIEGWQYNKDFIINGWSIIPTYDTQVRHRKWQRLLIQTNQLKIGKQRIQEFTLHRREYRSFNPQLIYCALKQSNFQLQYILECQRLALPSPIYNSRTSSASDNPSYFSDSSRSSSTSRPSTFNYSETNLLPTDPSQWSIVSPTLYPSNLIASIDPTTLPCTQLVDAYPFLYSNPNGINSLHEFIFTIYPNKDSMGWEYNTDFEQTENWSSSPQPTKIVRRRVWFRTLVPLNSLYQSRQNLSSYIQLHPRGLCHQGLLQRLSQYRKRWTQGIARINNSTLTIELENNYQKNYTFNLQNCEAHPIDSITDFEKFTQSSSTSNLPDWNDLSGNGTNTARNNLFCICSINSSGQYTGIQAIFNALTLYERTQWIMILSHQIALYNISFWPLKSSPPIVDNIVHQGELYKLGHVVQNWKLRKFELTQRGILSYYKGNELKGKIRLRGSQIEWNQITNGIRNEIKIKKIGGYELVLRGKSAYEMNQWMNEIKPYTGMDTDEKVLFPSLTLLNQINNNNNNSQNNNNNYPTHTNILYNETSLPVPPNISPQSSTVGRHHSISYLPTDRILFIEEPNNNNNNNYSSGEQITNTTLMELFPEEEYNNTNDSTNQQTTLSTSIEYQVDQDNYISSTNYYEEVDLIPSTSYEDNSILQVEQIALETKIEEIKELDQFQNINEVIESETNNQEEKEKEKEKKEEKEEEIDIEIQTNISNNNQNSNENENNLQSNINQINSIRPFETQQIPIETLRDSNDENIEFRRQQYNISPDENNENNELLLNSNDVINNTNTRRTTATMITTNTNTNQTTITTTTTHEIVKDNQGRRVSLLNVNIVDSAQQNIIWGGNDSDESDRDSTSRSSSFSDSWHSNDIRPLSLISNHKSQSGPLLNIETTHEIIKDQHGRRVSVLNTDIVNSVEENIIWGGNDSDESDSESSSRSSSFSDSWNTHNSRPLSLRINSTSSQSSQLQSLSSSYHSGTEIIPIVNSTSTIVQVSTSPPPSPPPHMNTTQSETETNQEIQQPETKTFSSYFGFGKNRRKSL